GSDPHLKNRIATFYGACLIEDVIDEASQSIKAHYMLDCCLVLEVLNGSKAKVLAVWNPLTAEGYSYVGDAYSAFRQKGFDLADADIFNYDDPERFKFIDFA